MSKQQTTNPDHHIAPLFHEESYAGKGLTKREHFAGIALQGMLSNAVLTDDARQSAEARGLSQEEAIGEFILVNAHSAVRLADALVDALNSSNNTNKNEE
jgi:hypothetical protein